MLDKLHNILLGWKGYLWEDKEVRALAQARAIECAKCEMANWGLIAQFLDDDVKQIKGLKCAMCECPLSTKLRSREENCQLEKW